MKILNKVLVSHLCDGTEGCNLLCRQSFSDFQYIEADVWDKSTVATSSPPTCFSDKAATLPLQTQRILPHLNHSVLQVSVHCLQFQNESYMILDIVDLVKRRW